MIEPLYYTLIGGLIAITLVLVGWALTYKFDNLYFFGVFVIIGFTVLGVFIYYQSLAYDELNLIDEQRMDKEIMSFEKLDCKSKGDYILKNYLDGNTTFTSKALPIFTKSGCQFDVGTQIILEGVN